MIRNNEYELTLEAANGDLDLAGALVDLATTERTLGFRENSNWHLELARRALAGSRLFISAAPVSMTAGLERKFDAVQSAVRAMRPPEPIRDETRSSSGVRTIRFRQAG